MKKISLIILIISVIFSSCKNGDWEFPDNDVSAVYFAYQSPVRTITLGKDYVNDNTFDNNRQCQIMATVGGFYNVKKDIEISFRVENSLCDHLENVTAMPSDYYSLSDNGKMIIKKGSKMIGGVVVQLTDAFFNDPLSLSAHYVIPLVITGVKNADRILAGTQADGVSSPNRLNPEDWKVLPKDYTLFAVKYINPYDLIYLRRGTDNITEDGDQRTVERPEVKQGDPPKNHPEDDEVIKLSSISLNEIEFPVNNHRNNNVNLNMTFKLNFSTNQTCTFANGAWKDNQLVDEYTGANFRVFDITVSGNGEYRSDGEKNSWGNKDRDALYLNYTVEYKVENPLGSAPQAIKYVTTDILVFRDRDVSLETFEPKLKP